MRLKFRIKIVEKWRFSSWVALFISLCLIGTAAAYYSDREQGGLDGSSVPLDFILEATPWVLATDAVDLDPGESVTKTIRVVDDASFSTPFKYGVKTVPTGGDLGFCSALELEAEMDGVPAYTGPLLDFDFWPVTFDPAGSLWTMRVYLPSDASVNDGESCEFDFLYQGWQERFAIFPQGYHDEELVSDRLATGSEAPQCRLLNFETDAAGTPIAAGQRIDTEYSAWGVTIAANNAHPNGNHPDWAIAFNSAAPTGDDPDLGTPNSDFGGPGLGQGGRSGQPGVNNQAQGKLLIISENKVDANADGLVDSPDDEANGGQINFTFDESSTIEDLRLFDIEETGVVLRLYDEANALLTTINVPSLGDNSAQTLALNQEGVKRLEISLVGSGGLDDLCFSPSALPPPPLPLIGESLNDNSVLATSTAELIISELSTIETTMATSTTTNPKTEVESGAGGVTETVQAGEVSEVETVVVEMVVPPEPVLEPAAPEALAKSPAEPEVEAEAPAEVVEPEPEPEAAPAEPAPDSTSSPQAES